MTAVLVIALALTDVVLVVAGWQFYRLQRSVNSTERAGHAKCTAHIADVTSRRFIAARLRELADKYDSLGERPVMSQLQRQHVPSGPSIPASWLNLQAELLDPTKFNRNEVALPKVEL